MKNKKALTLVELIVSITISILLMSSIGVFLSSGLTNLFSQEKSISNTFEINNFLAETRKNFKNLDENKNQIFNNNSIIFKNKKGGFTYIGTTEKDFCENGQKTKHIFIKNFTPKSISNNNFQIKNNQVFENGNLLAGNKIFGQNFESGDFGEDVSLNSPSSVTKDSEGNYFISDTLNNRILFLNKEKKVYEFLGESILNEPNEINFSSGKLKIANAGKGEILEYEEKEITNNFLQKNIDFNPKNNIFPDEIEISFRKDFSKKYGFLGYSEEEIKKENIFLTNLDFPNFEIKEKEKNGKKIYILKPKNLEDFYSFDKKEDFASLFRGTKKIEINGKEIYEVANNFYLKETENETLDEKIYKLENLKINFNLNFENKINLGNLKGRIYMDIDFLSNKNFVTSKKNELIYENIYSEKIKILEQNLNYPYSFGKNFDLKNPGNFINFDENNDTILNLPIKNLEISQNGNYINLILKYYKNYNCQDIDTNEQKISTIFLKKKIN